MEKFVDPYLNPNLKCMSLIIHFEIKKLYFFIYDIDFFSFWKITMYYTIMMLDPSEKNQLIDLYS